MRLAIFIFIITALFSACTSSQSEINGSAGRVDTIAIDSTPVSAEQGQQFFLEWDVDSSQGTTVTIEGSTDEGQSWELVEAGVANSGSYAITLPTTVGSTVVYRVLDVSGKLIAYSPLYSITAAPTPTPEPTPLPLEFSWVGMKISAIDGFQTNNTSIDKNSEAVSTFRAPMDVEFDASNGQMYVVEKYIESVKRYDSTSGSFLGAIGWSNTVYEDCIPFSVNNWCDGGLMVSSDEPGGYDEPSGLAIDNVNRKLYVADTANHRIQRIDLDTGDFEAAIGGVGDGYISTSSSLNGPQEFSISLWFKSDAPTGTPLIAFHNTQTGDPYRHDRKIYMQADGIIRTGVYDGSTNHNIASTLSYNDGNWHHVVMTFKSNEMKLYVDGTEVASSVSPPNAQNFWGYWKIGYDSTSWTNAPDTKYIQGEIDSIGIWNTVLTPTEISALNASQSIGSSSPQWNQIAFAWNLDQDSGDFTDVSGNENHGQAQGNFDRGITGVSNQAVRFFADRNTDGWTSTTKANASGSVDGVFDSPKGVALDTTNGILYVSDLGNDRISKFNATTGKFIGAIGNLSASTDTCPGSGAAGGWCQGGTFTNGSSDGMFDDPYHLEVDPIGNALYVADRKNHRVHKYNATTGAFVGAIGLTTSTSGTCSGAGAEPGWCTGGTFDDGTGDGMFKEPLGIDLDNATNSLFVTDSLNSRVVKVNLATGAFIGAIGNTTATTGDCPATGVTDSWCTGGTFDEGDQVGMYQQPIGVTFHQGRLAITDYKKHQVTLVNANTGDKESILGAFSLGATTDWAPISKDTGPTYSSSPGGYGDPYGFAVDREAGYFYIVHYDSNRVSKHQLSSGAEVGAIGRFSSSTGTCPNGGTATGWCAGGVAQDGNGDGQFDGPEGIALDTENDRMFVSEYVGERVSAFVLSTGEYLGSIGELTGSTGDCPASGIAPGWCKGGVFDYSTADGGIGDVTDLEYHDGHLYIISESDAKVSKFNAVTGAFVGSIGYVDSSTGSCVAGAYSGSWCTGGVFAANTEDGAIGYPSGLDIDEINGHLLVQDGYDGRLNKYEIDSGTYLGSLGFLEGKNSNLSGTCPESGPSNGWCTGGDFDWSKKDGGMYTTYGSVLAVPEQDTLYISNADYLSKFVLSSGAFIGSIGYVKESTGTCIANAPAKTWCTGGTFIDSPNSGFSYSTFMQVDENGHLLVQDSFYQRIMKVVDPN